jgi:Leucine-rich repeat (LRR) protein
VLAGQPEQSPLFLSLVLPLEDERHMPPKGKPQLSVREISMLHHWIKKGATFGAEIQTLASGQKAEIIPLIELPAPTPQEKSPSDAATSEIAAAEPEALQYLRAKNLSINTLGNDSPFLSVNFVNVKQNAKVLLEDLQSIQAQVAQLKINELPIGEPEAQKIARFANLTHLNLANTSLEDQALSQLAALPRLEQLNLYGNNISDAGLLHLAKCRSLKTLYVWQTEVSPAGIARLKKALPDLRIENESPALVKPDSSINKQSN